MAEAIDAWGGITYNDVVRVTDEPLPTRVYAIMQEADGGVYFCLEHGPNVDASDVTLHEDDPSRKRIGCCADRRKPCGYHEGYLDAWTNRWLAELAVDDR